EAFMWGSSCARPVVPAVRSVPPYFGLAVGAAAAVGADGGALWALEVGAGAVVGTAAPLAQPEMPNAVSAAPPPQTPRRLARLLPSQYWKRGFPTISSHLPLTTGPWPACFRRRCGSLRPSDERPPGRL